MHTISPPMLRGDNTAKGEESLKCHKPYNRVQTRTL